MDEQNIQMSYQLISSFMRYPTKAMFTQLKDVKEALTELDIPLVQRHLNTFVNNIEELSYETVVEYYTEYFDFSKVTNFYVTYLNFGEQRERGLELLKIKQYYKQAGFSMTDKELPDYLPLMLEFCAQVPLQVSYNLLSYYKKNIEVMYTKLTEVETNYVNLFDALFATIESSTLVLTE